MPPRPPSQPARNYGAARAFEFPDRVENRPALKSKGVSHPRAARQTFPEPPRPGFRTTPAAATSFAPATAFAPDEKGRIHAAYSTNVARRPPKVRSKYPACALSRKFCGDCREGRNRGIWRRFRAARPFGTRGTTIEIRRAGRRRVRRNEPPPTEIDICARGGKTVGANVERPGRLFEERALSGAFAWKESSVN